MLRRKRQLAAKIESVEGVAETLAAQDAKLLIVDPKFNPDFKLFERNPVRANLSKMGKLTGTRSAGITFQLELRGSGTATVAPEWSKLIEACGFTKNVLRKLTVGTITGGAFLHGETITQSTTGASGRVVIDTATGTTSLYFVDLDTGTWDDENGITGQTSGASATPSSVENAGIEWKPLSDDPATVTMGLFTDGLKRSVKGARGKVKFSLKSGEPAMMDFEFQGVFADVANADMLSGVLHETSLPPVFLDAKLTVDDYAAIVSAIELNCDNTLSPRESVNDANGILSYRITERNFTGSIDPEMVLTDTIDFFDLFANNSARTLDFTVGSQSGNKFRFYIPKLVISDLADEERDGIDVAGLEFDLIANGQGDDELTILQL